MQTDDLGSHIKSLNKLAAIHGLEITNACDNIGDTLYVLTQIYATTLRVMTQDLSEDQRQSAVDHALIILRSASHPDYGKPKG